MKQMLKNVTAMLLVIVMLLSLAACGGSAEAGGETEAANALGGVNVESGTQAAEEEAPSGEIVGAKDTVNIQVYDDPGTLDPIYAGTGWNTPRDIFYETMWANGPDGNRVYILAESSEWISDTELVIKIRQGVTFANGNPLTAQDVLFTIKLWSETSSKLVYVQELDVDACYCSDDYTLHLILPKFNLIQDIVLGDIFIMDEESYNAEELATKPNGTGPYKLVEYVTNSHLIAEARDDYWKGTPHIKNVVCKVMDEGAVITAALEAGEIDALSNVPISDLEYISSMEDMYLVSKFSPKQVNIGFSKVGSIFENVDARKAVACAVERKAIIDIVYEGNASLPQTMFSAAAPDFEESYTQISDIVHNDGIANYERAKEFAEAAGLVGKEVSLILNGTDEFVAIAEIVQANLAEIGVTVNIQAYDKPTFDELIKDPTNYDMVIGNTTCPSGLGINILQVFPTLRTWCSLGAKQDEFMAMANDCVSTVDDAARAEKMLALTTMASEELPWFPLLDAVEVYGCKNSLENYKIYRLNEFMVDEWYWSE